MKIYKIKDKSLINRYFYYFLISIKKYNLNNDTLYYKFKNLDISDFEYLYTYLPTIEIQEQIISILEPIEVLKNNINQSISTIKNILINWYK